ncbi:MAG: cell division ATP-binding protein FtsE [Acetivibrionales bacterium]|nr:cell division ATP-binding protein FtsE [Bacillota bacterium]NLP06947.1 cell division ATP-binding protein FtsE [Clostridiaceae bacterium]HOA55831.1 cell division ATP-binding protein FtsE [Clostridiales bacterium]HPZ05057.1 cell division ATP-binding protein FtsE [Clostridiales bacterium]HQD31682.1 cell division ATP-binding protein FtsE [Clostridiales bacterium]
MVELRGVSKTYPNGTVALRDVNLKLDKGEFVFLVGPSGSGKSTLVKLLLKEEDATEGEVYVNGYDVTSMTRQEIPFLRRSLGVVFQDFRLLPNKTVYENVAFAMIITEALPKEIRRQVPMALALVGLSRKANMYPNQLSGGEQQRVALARALVNNPALLIADEPTGNLDPETSWEIMKLLSEINHRGTTVIVATHEKSIVDEMKKRVVSISKGLIVRDQEKGLYRDEDKNNPILF